MWLQRLAADPVPVGSGVTARGGPGALSEAVAGVATAAGASLRPNSRVVRLLTENGRATGVVLSNGDELSARVVVAAISPKAALCDLAPAPDVPPSVLHRFRNVRARGVTAKINLALSALPTFPAFGADTVPLGGRLLIAPGVDYVERAFDATKYGALSEQLWLEASIPSVRDQALAPAGGHVMSVYAHFVPRDLRSGSWESERSTLAARVMDVLEARAPGIGSLVTARQVITPADLEQHWGLPGGHIFHAECTIDQMWAARPVLGWSRYRTPIGGLYLASAGAHPGGGLTGLPGYLAAQAVRADLKSRAT